jgi:hypothetical protein
MNLTLTSSERLLPARLLDQVRRNIRDNQFCIRIEQTYVDSIRRFILHSGKRHPGDLGATEVETILTHLAAAGSWPHRR